MTDTKQKPVRWYKIKDKQPEHESIVLRYSDHSPCYFFSTYLAPRRFEELGDWEDGEDEERCIGRARPNDYWFDFQDLCLFDADAIEGRLEFVCKEVNRNKKRKL